LRTSTFLTSSKTSSSQRILRLPNGRLEVGFHSVFIHLTCLCRPKIIRLSFLR
jgi:hypothetical protein